VNAANAIANDDGDRSRAAGGEIFDGAFSIWGSSEHGGEIATRAADVKNTYKSLSLTDFTTLALTPS